MAQLGPSLRFHLTGYRSERAEGLFAWARPREDKRVYVAWRAETRRPVAGGSETHILAEGEMTGDEVRWWAGWFANAGAIRGFPNRLGDTPAEPVARLWTPLAGSHVEWFAWPEPLGGLAVLALFAPDEAAPWRRESVEQTVSVEDLAAFGRALETEYQALLRNP